LGLAEKIGSFEIGHFFDFVAVDLNSQRLKKFAADPSRLLDALVFGCGNAELSMVGVSGRVRY
jgi:cytosine/adenosine deaminase-related metal-dependent hydrolase